MSKARSVKWDVEHLGFADQPREKEDPNLKKGRRAYSNYFATYNTNKTPAEIDPKYLESLLTQVLDKETIADQIYYVNEEGRRIPEDHGDQIESIKLKTVVEVGGKMNYVHFHFLLAITHYTRLRIDYLDIKDVINAKLQPFGIKVVYTNHKLYRDAAANIDNYIAKTHLFSGSKKTNATEIAERGPSMPKKPSAARKQQVVNYQPEQVYRSGPTPFIKYDNFL